MADSKPIGALGKSTLGPRGRTAKEGQRGKRGPTGPAGPGGPATSLDGPTSGDGALIADVDIPAGYVIAAGGSAVLAEINLDDHCNLPGNLVKPECENCVILNPLDPEEEQIVGSCGAKPSVGVSSQSVVTGQVVRYVSAGPLTLDTGTWDAAIVGGSGGLIPNAIYYLSTTPGKLTTAKPTSGAVTQVGVAFSATTFNVGLLSLPSGTVGGGMPVLEHAIGDFAASVNRTNIIPSQEGDVSVTFPPAASVTNGTLLGLSLFNTDGEITVNAVPSGSDKINNTSAVELNATTLETTWVSDGVSNWYGVSRYTA